MINREDTDFAGNVEGVGHKKKEIAPYIYSYKDFSQSFLPEDAPQLPDERPYEIQKKELLQLLDLYKHTLHILPAEAQTADVISLVLHRANDLLETGMLSQEELARIQLIIELYSEVFDNYLLYRRMILEREEAIKNDEGVMIYHPNTNLFYRSVSKELFLLLRMSRGSTLESPNTKRKRQQIRYRFIGASVAGATILRAVKDGAMDVVIADADTISGSNQERLAGLAAHLYQIGEYKVDALLADMYAINPFGNYRTERRLVMPDNLVTDNSKHIPISEYVEEDTLLIDVADSYKAELRIALFQAGILIPIISLADTHPTPFGLYEVVGEDNPFGQRDTYEEWKSWVVSAESLSEVQLAAYKALTTVKILEDRVPAPTLVSFIHNVFGLQSFLPQEPADPGVSASIFSKLLRQIIEGIDVKGRPLTLTDLTNLEKDTQYDRSVLLNFIKLCLSE